ncbi:MAG: hypothetical protein JJE30_16740 [Desulfuromonadales bacterium]|nr:hypothetical protein [Desulfuromonadales bacterium]
MKTTVRIILALIMLVALDFTASLAATMNDYCVTPPFIQESTKPNLLLLIDNSASMYDLAYDDKGYKRCSSTTSQSCSVTTDCPSGQTCTQARNPSYCFDETFDSSNSYVGYFDHTKNYKFNFSTNRFQEEPSIPANCAMAAVADQIYCKLISNTLHLNIDKTNPAQTKYFYASGKYLNWLTSSKFDVEKQVLTGGKYVTKVCSNNTDKACLADSDCGTGNTCNAASAFLQPESRGCVGMGYVKDANISNFVNYATGTANSNTGLGLTFLVKGPQNLYNAVAPSTGGQTYLEIFSKSGTSYDYEACQLAVEAIATANGTGQVASAVDNCLAASGSNLGTCQQNAAVNCSASYGPTTPNCDIPIVPAHCSGDASITNCTVATQATDCFIAGAKTCSAGKLGVVCADDTACNVKACTLNAARSCSVDANCVKTAQGYCSSKTTKKCNTDATCNSGEGTCVDKPYNDGTCGIVTPGVCTTIAVPLDVGPCVERTGGYIGPCVLTPQAAAVKTKTTFTHSMQACWALRKTPSTPIGHDEYVGVKGECSDIYGNYKTCSNNGYQICSGLVAGECGAGTCLDGPAAIQSGNPGLICSNNYEGQLFEKNAANAWVIRSVLPAATPGSCLATDTVEDCAKKIQTQFCNLMDAPPVTDPTNPPSAVVATENLPAILIGIGVEAQLGAPILTLPVRVETPSPPSKLVQEYANKIRIGLMAFNNSGSASETSRTLPLPAGKLAPTKVCSNDATISCTQPIDCGPGNRCDYAADKDGASVLSLIGKGRCLTTAGTGTGTSCTKKAHCTTSNENCVSDGVGDHTTAGLVWSIDSLRAATWTPVSEAFYNAIGYFAVDYTSDTTGKTSRTDLRINPNDPKDFPDAMNPSEYVCQSNNILLVTDGSSAADQYSDKTDLVNTYSAVSGNVTGNCSKYAGSQDLDDLAWLARHRNINTFDKFSDATPLRVPLKNNESITSYIVFTGADNGGSGDCNNTTLLTKTATNGGTSLLKAENPQDLKDKLTGALDTIAANSSSGTAASILSNSEGSGAALLQALFYPKKEFDKINSTDTSPTSTKWIGELQSFWYYLDPNLQKTSIREDTTTDFKLNLRSDKVIQFYFDSVQGKTLVNKYSDLDGDGAADSSTPDTGGAGVQPETIKSLWQAGRKLWERDVTSSSTKRTIYTGYNSTMGNTPQKVSSADSDGFVTDTTAWDLLQIPASSDTTVRKARAVKLIDYIHGTDQPNDTLPWVTSDGQYRPRKVYISGCGLASCNREWKLGDIVSSTPKIASNNRINNFDLNPPTGYNDISYGKFTRTTGYRSRGMAFVGANDGMLHAFKLGVMKELNTGGFKAEIDNANGTIATSSSNLGNEEWAYIPKHTLPYLKYFAENTYGHIYSVDKSPLLVDASIGLPTGCTESDVSNCPKSSDGSTWRTIVLGGMGIGGAAQASGSTAVKPPLAGTGYSSYFALEVTDPANPKYMWEFPGTQMIDASTSAAGSLGFSTAGPAIVRIAAKVRNADGTFSTNPDPTKNGKWFAVFASGPIGPIDTDIHTFKGESDQRLRIFIVDLATGTLLRTFDASTVDAGLLTAFGGSLASNTFDADRSSSTSPGFYSDDSVYIGYVQKDTSVTPATWTKGGVLRLSTHESTDPATWTISKLIDGVGPVTSAISKIQDRNNKNFWVFFGTGRFFYKKDDTSSVRQALYGVKEPCYSTTDRHARTPYTNLTNNVADNRFDAACDDSVSSALIDQSGDSAAPAATLAATAPGWKILLDQQDTANQFLTERVITDPLGAPSGAVFFTTYKPNTDLCQYGGNSLLWAVRYDTGSTPPASAMKGKALMQVSTGAFQEITLSDAFNNPGSTRYDKRRLAVPITGVPPTGQGAALFTSPPPAKKLLHIQEK